MKDLEVGSLQMFADFTRRVCYYDCQGKTDLFKMLLPSDSALTLHAFRANYIMQLVMECNIAVTDTHETTNEGWVVDKGKVAIKWEDNMNEIKKGLQYKKPPMSAGIGCGCKKGCSLSTKLTTRCKICTKQCNPCRAECGCKGLCNNPHNNGGKCSICKTVTEPERSNNSSANQSESDSEDSEEEFIYEADDDNVDFNDFNDFFGDLGSEGMLQLAPRSALVDEFSETF